MYLKVLLFTIFKLLRDLILENHCNISSWVLLGNSILLWHLSVCNITPHLWIFLLVNNYQNSPLGGSLSKRLFLKIVQNLQENTCARVSFLIKNGHWHRCFPVNFANFYRTPPTANSELCVFHVFGLRLLIPCF